MAKVHPNVPVVIDSRNIPAIVEAIDHRSPPAVLTVWRKSLLFNCNGFTVFDSNGNLIYRVDNYAGAATEVVLMDAAGKPLVTLRRKRLSLAEQWLVYDGEGGAPPRYLARRNVSIGGHSKTAARVSSLDGRDQGGFVVEGSYCRRCCVVYDESHRPVAEIRKKEPACGGAAFGDDVFRLVVMPGMDAAISMAIVIVLDLMFKH